MRAAFGDDAVNQNNNLVGVAHGGGAVGNQNSGTALHNSAQAAKDAFLGLGVHGGKGIIEDQNARVAGDSAGDGGALLLSAGESDATFADHGVVGFAEVLHVAVEAGNVSGFADAPVIIFRQAKGDVAADGFAKQVSVLGHEADGLAQSGERPLANRTPVDQDAVIGGFPKTRDESGEGGLATAGGADDGKRRGCRNFQSDW